MKFGIIGLGKMGAALAVNGKEHGLDIVVFSEKPEKINALRQHGIEGYSDLKDFVLALRAPRAIWMMVPAGAPVDATIDRLIPFLEPGDYILDGGNSHYQDSIRRYRDLKEIGMHFLDVGTSGGTEGARNGACLMVGGDSEDYTFLEPIFFALSNGNGCGHMGSSGSGHYVKMIHNGIEYGMMQAMGEGLQILQSSSFDFDLSKVASVWQKGSIISGLLMDVTAEALKKEHDMASIAPVVHASGEANWTLEEAIKLQISTPVIAAALFARFKSTDSQRFSEKTVAAMRREFGGHGVVPQKEE